MLNASVPRATPLPSPGVPIVSRIDRRRRDSHAAKFVERVTEFARWLPADEAALVRAVYVAGRTAGELAALARVPSRAIQRRIQKVLLRVLSREFRASARRLELAPAMPDWPPPAGHLKSASESTVHLAVLRAVFIEGLSMRATAQRLDLPLHVVRRHHETARLEIEAKAEARAS
ncbi:MAG: hypothetical protein K2Y21_00125 [Phycisphaerales bacterium]|nr:hypothetical protein [Phycisphaerales bacterium]